MLILMLVKKNKFSACKRFLNLECTKPTVEHTPSTETNQIEGVNNC